MADRKITELAALSAGGQATGDLLTIVDVSESAAADKNKKITVENLFKGIPGNVGVGVSSPSRQLTLSHASQAEIGLLSGADTSGGLIYQNASEQKVLLANRESDGHIAFQTGGANERMRIDSSGNVGIGETSADTRLHIKESTTGATGIFIQNSNGATNSSADLYFGNWSGSSTTTPQARIQAINKNVNTAATDLVFWTYNGSSISEQMRIDSSGQVILNNSAASGDATVLRITGGTSGSSVIEMGDTADTDIGQIAYYQSNNAMAFRVNASEALRINSSGTLLVGKTSDAFGTAGVRLHPTSDSHFTKSDGVCVSVNRLTSDGSLIDFYKDSSQKGSISISGSSTAYNTTSDHRLKENVVDLSGAISRIKQLAPKRFNFIADAGTTVDGFLAHEAQTVVPEAVTGTHNEVDNDGNPVMQGIDQSKLVPLLTAALQEAISKIETLEAKVAALEAQ